MAVAAAGVADELGPVFQGACIVGNPHFCANFATFTRERLPHIFPETVGIPCIVPPEDPGVPGPLLNWPVTLHKSFWL